MLDLPTDHLQILSKPSHGNSLAVQWLGHSTFNVVAWVQSLQGTKIPQAARHSQKKYNNNNRKKVTCQCFRDHCPNKVSATDGM